MLDQDAVFISQSVPAQMVVGQRYPVAVTLRNIGHQQWSSSQSYRLGAIAPLDTLRWGMSRVDLPVSVWTNNNVTVNFEVTAPLQAGNHVFQWRMVQDGVAWFGESTPATSIQVLGSAVVGHIDSVDAFAVRGWACSTRIEAAIDVHLYTGGPAGTGTGGASTRAELPATANVAAACGTQGSAHGFAFPLTDAIVAGHHGKTIHIHGISPVGAANAVIARSGELLIPANSVPTVVLTSPANGAVIGEGQALALSAQAADADDGVASVVFLGNGSTLATTAPPGHAYNWYVNPGDYTVQARVQDTRGASALSAVHNVHVSKVMGSITSVSASAVQGWACSTNVAAPVTVRLLAGGGVGSGTVLGDYPANLTSSAAVNASCGKGTAHAFSVPISPAMLQAHEGKSIHGLGLSAFGGPHHALSDSGTFALPVNRPPVVAITAPAAATVYQQPASFTVQATASDPDGNLASVNLLVNGVLKETRTSAPFNFAVQGLTAGTQTLSVVATDSSGATASAQRSVVVEAPPVAGPSSVARQYVYDAENRLCKVIEPESGVTVLAYDAAGNLAWSASGLALTSATNCDRAAAEASGRVVRRSYDARNRIATLRFPDQNGDTDFAYTLDGLLQSAVVVNDGGSATATTSYQYTTHRQLAQERLAQTGVADLTVTYTYNTLGHLAQLGYPSGRTVAFAPNALGQATKAGDFATAASYHPNGQIKQFTYANGIVHSSTLNSRQLPARIMDGNVLTLDSSYDANGNVTGIGDLVLGTSFDRQMQYDKQDRLIRASSAGFGGTGVAQISYDALDNIRSWSLPGVKEDHYGYDANNRLTNLRDGTGTARLGLGYDLQGNLATRNGQQFRFDHGNRLREVVGSARYRYDVHGRRIHATRADGGVDVSLYNSAGQLLYQRDQVAGKRIESIFLGGQLVVQAQDTGGTPVRYYQHLDALGTPVAVTNGAGQVVERTHYAPYGAAINRTVDGVGYTGHRMDAATGLTYMQQRYMDPELGVFLSVDPVTAYEQPVGMFNRYRYASGNPYRYIDPDGSCDTSFCQFWGGVGRAMGDAVYSVSRHAGPSVYGTVDMSRTRELNNGPFFGMPDDQVGQGGYRFGSALAAAEGVRIPGRSIAGMVKLPPQTKTVGRYVHPNELKAMRKTGYVQEGGGGQTRVSDPPSSQAYRAAPRGDIYVEFEVPAERVLPHSSGTGRIPGPNSLDAKVPGRSRESYAMPRHEGVREVE